MKNLKNQLPQGTYDFLPDECDKKTALEMKLRQQFVAQGYREIQTPAFEYYDVFTHDSVPYGQEHMIKFFDLSGRILVLRPEMTVPIARVAATKLLQKEKSLRLFYLQNVYGYLNDSVNEQSEVCQAGVELIGVPGCDGDTEVVRLAIECLKLTGLAGFKLEVGDVSFFKGLIADAGLSDEQEETIRALIDTKNTVELEYTLDTLQLPYAVKRKLLALPNLFGEGEVFDAAYALAENDLCKRAVDNLKEIYERICILVLKDYITVDFGLLNNYKYYSGIIFRGITNEVGSPILSGGRYDNLLGEFGTPAPATGFALRIREILSAMEKSAAAQQLQDHTLTIALAKGRLAKKTQELLAQCGVDVSALEDEGRKLILEDAKNNIRFLMVKPSDVPVYVYHGVADMGVVGKDTLLEAGLPMYEVLDLKCARCKMSVAGYEGRAPMGNVRKIATKYPRIAQKYYASKGEDIEIIKLHGSIEIAPMLGLSDVIVDIVESGRTLKENGLCVLEDICDITARLVVNRVSMKTKTTKIAPLIEKMRALMEEK